MSAIRATIELLRAKALLTGCRAVAQALPVAVWTAAIVGAAIAIGRLFHGGVRLTGYAGAIGGVACIAVAIAAVV